MKGHSTLLLAVAFSLPACAASGGGEPGAGPDVPRPIPHLPPHPVEQVAEEEWRLYRGDGTVADLGELARAITDVEVVFVGERHGNAGGHRFQRDLLAHLLDASDEDPYEREIVLSMEMFERDVQPVLDEYLDGWISEEHFLAAARPWPRYEQDYRPLVEAARDRGLRVVAANAPRRYVNRVSRLGPEALDELPPSARAHLPPLPFPQPSAAYREEWNALMGEGHGHAGEGAFQAQALWDAAMAHSIARALDEVPDEPLVVHLTGAFHVENRTGTPEALQHYRPGTRHLVIAIRPVADPADAPGPETAGLADYLVVTRSGAPRPR